MSLQELVLESLSGAARERVIRYASRIGDRLSADSAQWVMIGAVAELAAEIPEAAAAGAERAMLTHADKIGGYIALHTFRHLTRNGGIASLMHRLYRYVAVALVVGFALGAIGGSWWQMRHPQMIVVRAPATAHHASR